jgi:hypothetical protein
MNADLLSVARATGSGSVPVFIFMILIASACRMIAQRKGRSGLLWFMLGGLFTVGALVGVVLIPPRAPRGTEAVPEPDGSGETHEQPAATVELRHARTVAFPVREPADRHARPTVIDEIETWLKTQR